MSQAPYAVRNIRFGTRLGADLKVWYFFFFHLFVGWFVLLVFFFSEQSHVYRAT